MNPPNYLKVLADILILTAVFGCSEKKTADDEANLWPEIEPFDSGYLKVSGIHEIYYELCGNPDGIPVFVIHGGPGAGCSPYMRRFFNPEKYLIVLHDQRGCGKSKPNKELKDNNTNALIRDIEQLRLHLSLDEIILFGGSWGTTLSIAYAEEYPANVEAMVLRGIYLATQEEEDDYFQRLKKYFPEDYQSCLNLIPDSVSELNNTILYNLCNSDTYTDWKELVKALDRLESNASVLNFDIESLDEFHNSDEYLSWLHTLYGIAYHYFVNSFFMEEGQLLDNISKIQDIPVTIVHGRYDIVCPPLYAYILHQNLPESKLIITELSGHFMDEKPIEKELLKAMKELEVIEDQRNDL
jgi:proline iminopeptidase